MVGRLWDDDQFEDIMMMSSNFLLMIVAFYQIVTHTITRDPAIFAQRLNWESFRSTFGHTNDFKRHMRMPQEDFELLLEYLREPLECNHEQSIRRGASPILPETKLYSTIRWLGGGSYSDIHLFVGISTPSFFRVVWETIDAINNCDKLAFAFPQSMEECMEAAEGFQRISFESAITNCVSVGDGYSPHIVTPPKKVGNVKAFFSGHKQSNTVNVQASCDSFCRFQYMGVAGPGNMPDRDAANACALSGLISNLPGNYVTILDAAYSPDTHACPLYYGVDRKNPFCDNFNYYGSQCRIRIEMAFGLMYQKWGILWRPLRVDIDRVKCVMQAIARLHNFCINCRLERDGIQEYDKFVEKSDFLMPHQEQRELGHALEAQDTSMFHFSTKLCTFRTKMAARVELLGLKRPGT
jgi:hypothetical protein